MKSTLQVQERKMQLLSSLSLIKHVQNSVLFIALLLQPILNLSAQERQLEKPDFRPRFQAHISMGFPAMTGLPKNIEQQLSILSELGGSYLIPVFNKKYLISLGISYAEHKYITDGRFSVNDSGQYKFELTPSNFKQHSISLGFIQMPILLCLYKNKTSINFGPYVSYLVKTKQSYRIDSQSFKENAPVRNKFHTGVQAELQMGIGTSDKSLFTIGTGFLYQISSFQRSEKSFRPLAIYFKLGVWFN